jgi:Xaa-Pro dipeptidase
MDDLYPRFSEEEFARRRAAVRATMARADAAALVAYGHWGSYNEVQFLSNYCVTWEAILIFPAEGEPTLLVQFFNHLRLAQKVSCVRDVRWLGNDYGRTVADNLRERGFTDCRIGLVGPFPFQRYESFRRALPNATLLDLSSEFLELRAIKSQEEIAFLRKGAEFSDLAIEALERKVRPGITEHQLAAIAEGAYLGLGGTNTIHYMGVTSMRNPSLCAPAQIHSNRIIQKGDVLITEISAQYHGYYGQILRSFTIGEPPTAPYQRLYDVAVETFNRVTAVIKPGATSEEVLDAAEYIHTCGFSICDGLVHGSGGGYWAPMIRTRRTTATTLPFTFKENMIIVIQPNVITEDNRMGVQVGEMMRITAAGTESLHRYPMCFIQCG